MARNPSADPAAIQRRCDDSRPRSRARVGFVTPEPRSADAVSSGQAASSAANAPPACQQVGRRPQLDEPPAVDDRDEVGRSRQPRPVGDDDDGPRPGQAADRRVDADLDAPGPGGRSARRGRRPTRRAAGPGRSPAAGARRRSAGSRPRRSGVSRPAGRSSTTSPSAARVTAAWRSASLASGRARRRLSATVPWKRCGDWGTQATVDRQSAASSAARSVDPTRIVPSSGSRNRRSRPTIVDLPAPVGPTIATRAPAGIVRLSPAIAGRARPG